MNATARLLHPGGSAAVPGLPQRRLVMVLSPQRKAPRAPFVILMLGLLITGVVGLLLLNTHIQHRAYELGQLHREVDTLRAQQEQLYTELDRLNSPQQVGEAAQRLGMIPAAAPVFIDLAQGSLVGQAQPQASGEALRLTPEVPAKPATIEPPPRVIEVPAGPAAAAEVTAQRQLSEQATTGRNTPNTPNRRTNE